ncbi:MAG: tetratricopeptide repeat protein [Terracidiphilus sp.]
MNSWNREDDVKVQAAKGAGASEDAATRESLFMHAGGPKRFRVAGMLFVCLAVLLGGWGATGVLAGHPQERITIDYPLNGTVMPPDMAAPTFLWRDPATAVSAWQIEVSFSNGAEAIHVTSKGEGLQIGEIDKQCVSDTNKLPELTPEQAAEHTWKPDAGTWSAIRKQAGAGAVKVSIHGMAPGSGMEAVSEGAMEMRVAAEPVGAPIFFRDVPLMPSETEKGFIKPLASSAIPLINWSMRYVGDEKSHVVMHNLHTCANCHSFSANGKTLGMDMDGPQNDKGLYAMVPVAEKMTIRNEDMVSWASFPSEHGSPVRVGFMSQVSPDGRYVVTTTRPSNSKSQNFYYVSNFKDYRFLQVFYPTRGILQWYDREEKKLRPLPGADDPEYLQANAVWSPDDKYLVFERAEATDPFPADGKMAAYANDPAEVKIQYDLYRIPFNGGKGGVPEAIEGASHNGMSNSFPKISPDGKWIVFVQAKNGQLMRPDSKLYIVPSQGGKARLMNCNTPLMNSWHSFSPNGRWLVFSSKSRSPYTQMFLTHIGEDGSDTPAVLIENATAANRAVNIPEFVNMPPSGIEHIDTPAVDFYKQFDLAAELAKKGEYEAAIPEWNKAIAMNPGDARAHNNFGQTLEHAGQTEAAIAEFRKAVAAKPQYPEGQNNLAIALASVGNRGEAIEHYKLAIEANPGYAEAHSNLGRALAEQGRIAEAIEQFEDALKISPEYSEAHNNLGFVLAKSGRLSEAIDQYNQAIAADPKYAHAYNNRGLALAMQGKLDDAVSDFGKAVALDPQSGSAEGNLGKALLESNDVDDALRHLQHALELGAETAESQTNFGVALAEKGQLAAAIPHFKRALEIAPAYADAHAYLGTALVMTGENAEALRHWTLALKSDPDNVRVLNDAAWMMSTSADAALRNGAEAVRLANHGVELTRGQDPMLLGTLAAAYAQAGEFTKAVDAEKRAADLAGQRGDARLAGLLKARMAGLENGLPVRER